MKIAVCDDDKEFLAVITKLLEQSEQGMDSSVTCYTAGEKLLEDYEEHKKCYDVVFMDIELKGMDGITLGKQLKELDAGMLLVFLTNYPEYAIRGYEAKAFRYVLKPVDEAGIKRLLTDIRKEQYGKQLFRISADGKDYFVPLEKIDFMDAQKKYTTIYVGEQQYLARVSLNEYEQQLRGKGFFRIHRKYLVNMCNITGWDGNQLMVGKHKLPISRRKEKEFREQFYGYLEKGIREC